MTKLIHENLSIVMTFCFSWKPLSDLIETKFIGEWKYLRKGLFEVSEVRAEKACLELAMFLRILDDDENLSGYLKQTSDFSFGRLILDGKPDEKLGLRDVCNKIIHASDIHWDLTNEEKPILVCNSREPKRWIRAEIDVVNLATFCGQLMH